MFKIKKYHNIKTVVSLTVWFHTKAQDITKSSILYNIIISSTCTYKILGSDYNKSEVKHMHTKIKNIVCNTITLLRTRTKNQSLLKEKYLFCCIHFNIILVSRFNSTVNWNK